MFTGGGSRCMWQAGFMEELRERIELKPVRTYVQPSEPIAISKWDYTHPDGLQRAYDLGRRDAKDFTTSLAQ